ncbi:hypothetical protein SAMN05216188_1136 [Lentzea xinjiangensis]|uniref:Peptidase inhibitor family I36 n=2 Tax=Lentzea xinjiangensis TaxID=402600 RepID=A0A1H9QEK4_9PSEU|nr:hypothetical protein SAMN05216188_1136 [Lentzea xinjiangensis]
MAAVMGIAALVTATPASAAQWCLNGSACFHTGDVGQVLVAQSENWHNLTGPAAVIRTIVNRQPEGDDACVASGLDGSGQRFCVDGGDEGTVPSGLIARSLRG